MDDDTFKKSNTIVKSFTRARVDLDECVAVGRGSEKNHMGRSNATSLPMTRVALNELVRGTEDQANNSEIVQTAHSLPKTAHSLLKTAPSPPMRHRQETVRQASKPCKLRFVVPVGAILLACIALIIWHGHWWRHEPKETKTQNESFCRICPEGFELSTPDAKFDMATSASAIKGLTCAEVLENAQNGKYDIGLFCPLVQSEAAGTCVCRDTSKAVTGQPTTRSTLVPTASPTTAQPSSTPTIEDLYVPPNPVPDNPARSYFNYDLNDNRFGPNAWSNIDMNGTYFKEFGEDGFGVWQGHLREHVADPTTNRCAQSGKQTPVDAIKTTGPEAECTAAHQIRPRVSYYAFSTGIMSKLLWQPGTLPLTDEEIEKLIDPNSLRIKLNRRTCLDLENNDCLRRPPLADFPNYSSTGSQNSDLLHLDIKVPGEHHVRGEAFDAEIQMMHIHLNASRIAYLGIPIRATADGYNENYQALLDQFQIVYDQHEAECAMKQRRGLRTPQGSLWTNLDKKQYSYSDDPDFQRRLQLSSKFPFDPYTAFMEWLFFYRYNGSSPDPPCFPVTWFVIERPIHINYQQLKQTKYLLFTHTNGNCEKTSVHNEDQSVARPIQPLGIVHGTEEKREIMSCMEGEFEPDETNS